MHRGDDARISVKIRWLLLSRMVIATFLLGVAAFIEFQGTEAHLNSSLRVIYFVIAFTFFTSILFIVFSWKFHRRNLSLLVLNASDLVSITFLVHFTGGIESVYAIFYSLVVIYAALLLGRKGGYASAAFGGLLYGLLLGSETWVLIRDLGAHTEYNLVIRQVAAKWFVQTASLFIISFLTSFVADQEIKLRKLLAEREDAFKELDLLHRHIIESIDAGVLTYDLVGRIKTFNRAAAEITGLKPSEVLNRSVYDLFPGMREVTNRGVNEATPGGNRFEISLSGKRDKKNLIGFSLSRLMGHDQRKIGEIMIFQDVSALREMERQVERSRKLALIGEMAAGLAHEMRNPLAAMGGSIQLLKNGLKLSDSDERLMQIILRGKEQLDRFLRDFLMLARPAARDREIIGIDELIEDVLESIRYGQEGIENIQIVHNGASGRQIMGNRSEVRQALSNIIVNAIQSMPEGGRLTISQSLIPADQLAYLMICAEDTGCGIEKENMEKIFEPFFTTKARGTGLGLAIVNRILESHGGWISVESKVGQGTKIELLFPAHQV